MVLKYKRIEILNCFFFKKKNIQKVQSHNFYIKFCLGLGASKEYYTIRRVAWCNVQEVGVR